VKSKKPYPHNKDIAQAILRVMYEKPYVKPIDFINEVKRILEERGYYTGLVSAKRIWKIYEEYARKGWVYDYLGVMENDGGE